MATRKHDPLPADLTKAEKKQIGRGVELYARKLDALAESARKLDRTKDANRFDREAEALREEIVDPAKDGGGTFYEFHEPLILKGLAFLVRNLRAAKGTMTGLGYVDTVDELEQEAARVEVTLIPKVDSQGSLALTAEQTQASLKDIADADGEPDELSERRARS